MLLNEDVTSTTSLLAILKLLKLSYAKTSASHGELDIESDRVYVKGYEFKGQTQYAGMGLTTESRGIHMSGEDTGRNMVTAEVVLKDDVITPTWNVIDNSRCIMCYTLIHLYTLV